MAENADMAGMAAPVAVAVVEVGMDKDDLGRAGKTIHQANEAGQHDPLRELNGKMVDTIPCSLEGSIATTGVAQNPAKGRQAGSNGFNGGPARAAGNPD
jgi:hypothetical protein